MHLCLQVCASTGQAPSCPYQRLISPVRLLRIVAKLEPGPRLGELLDARLASMQAQQLTRPSSKRLSSHAGPALATAGRRSFDQLPTSPKRPLPLFGFVRATTHDAETASSGDAVDAFQFFKPTLDLPGSPRAAQRPPGSDTLVPPQAQSLGHCPPSPIRAAQCRLLAMAATGMFEERASNGAPASSNSNCGPSASYTHGASRDLAALPCRVHSLRSFAQVETIASASTWLLR